MQYTKYFNEMDFNIQSYLQKFKHITPPDDFVKTAFVSAVKEEIGVDIEKRGITVQRGTIYVVATPALKSELYIKKPRIMKRLRESLNKERIADIR